MRPVPRILSVCALALAAVVAHAAEWNLSLDVRAVTADGRKSYLDQGQGKLRYGEDDGLHLGRFRAAWDMPLGEVFAGHAEVSSWGDDDRNPLDLTEAWLEYRPYPRAGFRTRVRLGAFYPPFSLENRATGWESPYTLTPSAISSWMGEELRTIGLEGRVEWLGTRLGHSFDLELTAAAFGWNDPAGTMLAVHGFALSDRQTTLFGRSGEPRAPEIALNDTKNQLFHEIDDRAGFYVGTEARYFDRAALQVLHYDNRADPTAYRPAVRDYAWDTRFDSAALRVETAGGWTAIAQWLDGRTLIEPQGFRLSWGFRARSALLSRRMGTQMVSARYDEFEVEFSRPGRPGSESGHATTVAYSLERGAHWRFMLEWLRVRSGVSARPLLLGETPLATETQIQLSVRYAVRGQL